ncbi:SGNH/GDSL hydrolase family protein [Aquipuribacter sp. SD81]|uniref:SGNH/GDSL hydrolase family protein n=1 Tax=Aquipuribacter sp. SD81 TaxID=3127703 RepID=UPI003019EF5B
MTTTRLVCVGDSFTEGMSDVLRPDGHHTGWADRVAVALAVHERRRAGGTVEYANLAVRGKLLDQVLVEQLPAALDLDPTVLTFHAGPNDVLRRGTDLPDLARRYESAVARAAGAVSRLVLFTAIGRAGGSGRLADWLADRFARFNDTVRAVADRHGATLVDMGRVPTLTDIRMWHVDRLHLNAGGHTRVAAGVLEQLGVTDEDLLGGPPGWWTEPLPPATLVPRHQQVATDVRWAREHLAPWVGRRLRGVSSGDGRVPKDARPRVVEVPS